MANPAAYWLLTGPTTIMSRNGFSHTVSGRQGVLSFSSAYCNFMESRLDTNPKLYFAPIQPTGHPGASVLLTFDVHRIGVS